MEYINKYRQLEAQELDMYGKDQPPSGPESNSVVIIHGATGSGKSTQLPQYILDHYTQRSAFCNIVVTQPRKIGASSIARWISKERSWTLGGLVGYQVGLEKIATEDTRLIYMTTGVLLQKIVSAKSLMEFTHVFIDEVILMSATINCKEFADYFAVPVQNKMNPAYVFEVEGKPHTIEEYYLNDLGHIYHSGLPPYRLEEPVITKDIYEVAVSLIQMFDDLDMNESGTEEHYLKQSARAFMDKARSVRVSHSRDLDSNLFTSHFDRNKTWSGAQFVSERSSVLVFLPGLGEINYMHELLTNMIHKRLQVYPLHSSVTLEEQNNIILSTNIAESSVTVPDVKYVIDFCLTRTLVCDEDTNYQSLRLSWASKTSCDQRKGRAGRVSKGYCYRLIHRDFWDSSIPDHVVPEMLRCPLGSTILKVKLLDMGEPRALLATALSPPSLSDIERTILLLKEVGALAVSGQREDENPHDGELTFLGRVLAQLPVSQQLGKLIVLGHVFGCLDECLIIAAALSLKNFFTMPFRQHLDGYRNKVHFSGSSKSDCLALVEAFKVVLAGAFYPNYFTFGQPDEEMAVRELAGKDPKTTVVLKHIPPYGFLYYKQLQSLFRQCGQVKSIVFDGTKVNVDFQKQTVDPMQVSFNTLDRPRTVADLLLTVDVTEVVEVGHFWGYRIDERNAELLKKLTAEINRLELVFFVDYGNRSHVDLDLLREIPCQFLELPFQALEFKICKMRPSAKSLICGEHWSGGANGRFTSLVSGCPLLVKVFSVVHSVLHVDVYRYSGAEDAVNIRDQNYEILKGFFAKSVETMPDASVSSPMKDDEKHLIRILLESFASHRLGAPNCKAGMLHHLVSGATACALLLLPRCVWIEKESINSVVISDSPADLHQRMLVAASLSVNETGSTMLLRETSLMPHIPGLPALLSMLFAPVMELRVDRDGKCYTGVLCGLGWNSTTEAPILPEHDIELAFDVCFNVEDIVEVRMA
ncbi:hypothetical protein U0070_009106 [Myodes glareolus]|uniref:RNA helicase n=1 Tax=Myodes glareolus TaxID=447135 RepID=A0AAW0HUY6_MYOGA